MNGKYPELIVKIILGEQARTHTDCALRQFLLLHSVWGIGRMRTPCPHWC